MKRIAIIGAGLSGLMAAYLISENTDASVIILEKGDSYAQRLSDSSPDLISGVGGAGTLFGGKFCFPPASNGVWKRSGYSSFEWAEFVDSCLCPFTVDELKASVDAQRQIEFPESRRKTFSEKYYRSLYIDKDKMNRFVKRILQALNRNDVDIKCRCHVLDTVRNGETYLAKYIVDEKLTIDKFDIIIYATGRSSAISIEDLLPRGTKIFQQSPDLGFRLSLKLCDHEMFGNIGQDIKLKSHVADVGIRTFCVCSGGDKALVDFNGVMYYDGHFGTCETSIANLGILARSPRLVGAATATQYCSYLEKYLHSDMSLKDFILCCDDFITNTNVFDEVFYALKKFVDILQKNGVLHENLDSYPVFLPSVDHLNPLVQTDSTFKLANENMYVIGDAVGLSRGYVQSLWTAYCSSRDVVMKVVKCDDASQGWKAI